MKKKRKKGNTTKEEVEIPEYYKKFEKTKA